MFLDRLDKFGEKLDVFSKELKEIRKENEEIIKLLEGNYTEKVDDDFIMVSII